MACRQVRARSGSTEEPVGTYTDRLADVRPEGSSSIGRAPVSKTGGWGFESLLPCARPDPTDDRTNDVTDTRASMWSRLTLFLRQVVAELRKVVYPTRPQLINYTIVVLVFVAIMIALVTVLDLAFGEAVRAVLG